MIPIIRRGGTGRAQVGSDTEREVKYKRPKRLIAEQSSWDWPSARLTAAMPFFSSDDDKNH